MLRRFGRKVQQSGVLAKAKLGQHFEKDISKRERRKRAIVRSKRRVIKPNRY